MPPWVWHEVMISQILTRLVICSSKCTIRDLSAVLLEDQRIG